MQRPFCHVLVGLPGSGKSTWCNIHVAGRTIPYNTVSTDNIIEAHAARQGKTYSEVFKDYIKLAQMEYDAQLAQYLAAGSNILVDRTNMTKTSRAKILRLVPDHYIKNAIVFTCKDDTLEKRLASRPGKIIPDFVIKSMRSTYQDPTLSEGFDDIIYVDTDKTIGELEQLGL